MILLSEMGSLVLAHAMFARLKHKYPGASIHALVFAKNREVLDLLGVIPSGERAHGQRSFADSSSRRIPSRFCAPCALSRSTS